jgi:ribosome-associated protein
MKGGDSFLELDKMKDQIIEVLEDKKAKEINVINIQHISTLADYFVICSGTSSTHIKTLADELKEKMEALGYNLLNKEGFKNSTWVLLDYGDVVVHIFSHEDREFYNLERLWLDGEITKINNDNE